MAYMRERKAFGNRLDDFQALQFRLADMATELEAARTFLWRAAAALDRKVADATLCAMAKRFGTDVGFEVANKALQLHGGYGILRLWHREDRARPARHQILEGTNEIMRLIVARSLPGARDDGSRRQRYLGDRPPREVRGLAGRDRLDRPKVINWDARYGPRR